MASDSRSPRERSASRQRCPHDEHAARQLFAIALRAQRRVIAAIAASIKEWGWATPALVGEDGGLIAGHARILAARQLGIVEIPVMVAAGWTGRGSEQHGRTNFCTL